MSSGARQILQIASEVTNGVTPIPFARTVLPFLTTSLDQTVNKTDDETITTGRLEQQGTITSTEYAGDITANMRYGNYDELISAAAFNDWVLGADDEPDVLTFGGTKRKTFSILRGYEDVDNFHTFKGVHVNTWSLNIPEEGNIETTFGLMGKGRVPSEVAPVGVVTEAVMNPTLSSISVGNILIDGESQVGTACITAFDFTWDNTMQVQRCLGNGLDIGAILETTAKGSGSFTIAWSKKAGNDYYERQFNNGVLGLEVFIKQDPKSADTNQYTLTLPIVEVSAPLPSGSKSDILQATFEFKTVEEAPTLERLPKSTP